MVMTLRCEQLVPGRESPIKHSRQSQSRNRSSRQEFPELKHQNAPSNHRKTSVALLRENLTLGRVGQRVFQTVPRQTISHDPLRILGIEFIQRLRLNLRENRIGRHWLAVIPND